MSGGLHLRMNGKLLLAGEYFVLDGGWSLAIPTRYGQSFDLSDDPRLAAGIHWRSVDSNGDLWFEARLDGQCRIVTATDADTAKKLEILLRGAQELGGRLPRQGISVTTRLDFPRIWGLGSSSTLVAGVARLFGVDALRLSDVSFGGSGYDVACAERRSPILYRRGPAGTEIRSIAFEPPDRRQLAFVFTGQKQDSRQAIAHYRRQPGRTVVIPQINAWVTHLARTKDTAEFENLLGALELLTARTLGLDPVARRFPDFKGTLKSLGAWGGDFILAVSAEGWEYIRRYFAHKQLDTVLTYDEMAHPGAEEP